MRILFHKNFEKGYGKLSIKTKNQVKKRLKFFIEDPFHPLLSNHVLHGEQQSFRSINITGDLRAVYRMKDDHAAEFVIIDTHSNLY